MRRLNLGEMGIASINKVGVKMSCLNLGEKEDSLSSGGQRMVPSDSEIRSGGNMSLEGETTL